MTTSLAGTTSNGVPYLAVPPASDAATAAVIILWHLMDAPRSEAAFAAALPLDGLDAWKVYLGLPTFGARSLPASYWKAMEEGQPVEPPRGDNPLWRAIHEGLGRGNRTSPQSGAPRPRAAGASSPK